MHSIHVGVKAGKGKIEKEIKIKKGLLDFLLHNKLGHPAGADTMLKLELRSLQQNGLLEKKKNRQIKELVGNMWLNL